MIALTPHVYLPENKEENLWKLKGVDLTGPGAESWSTDRILAEAKSKIIHLLLDSGVVPHERKDDLIVQIGL